MRHVIHADSPVMRCADTEWEGPPSQEGERQTRIAAERATGATVEAILQRGTVTQRSLQHDQARTHIVQQLVQEKTYPNLGDITTYLKVPNKSILGCAY